MMTNGRKRGAFLTVVAVFIGVLALSNCTKVLQHLRGSEALGIVILGQRVDSVLGNAILGPFMGLVLAAYAYGLWRLRPWVAPLSVAYAFYVPVNLTLFWYFQTGPEVPSLTFMATYLAGAFTGSIGTALYLAYHRDILA